MTTMISELLYDIDQANGSAAAELVERFAPMLRAVTRRAGVPEHTVADVVQTTWLRLLEAPQSIREPEHLGGWLRTVATREAWRTSGLGRREVPSTESLAAVEAAAPGPEDQVVVEDDLGWLRRSIRRLPQRQREVLTALCADPVPSYEEIAERTGMPVGSIGPTRARALERLRRLRAEESAREPGPPTPIRRPPAPRSGGPAALAVAS